MEFKKYKNFFDKYINIGLLILILFFEFFLPTMSFRYDILFIFIFVLLNVKNIISGYKDNKVMYLLCSSYILYKFVQAIILKSPDENLINIIWAALYGILNSLAPIIFFITILVSKIDEKYNKILKICLLSFTLVVIVYGIFTYIFDINLMLSGMYIFDYAKGRVVSFFGNPNAYGLLLIMMLIYVLFNYNINKIIKYLFAILIMCSICLTYGRSLYFVMVLTIFIYVMYLIFNKNIKRKLFSILAIFFISIITLYVPNNNYLYISLGDAFDSAFNTSITTNFYTEVDRLKDFIKIAESKEDTSSEKIYNNITRSKTNKLSSVQSRILFFNTSLEVFNENKFLGVGSLNYHKSIQEKFDKRNIDYVKSGLPHNYYVYSLTVDGLIGAVILFIILLLLGIKIHLKKETKFIIPELIYALFLTVNLSGDFMMKYFLVYVIIFISMNINIDNKINKKEEVQEI